MVVPVLVRLCLVVGHKRAEVAPEPVGLVLVEGQPRRAILGPYAGVEAPHALDVAGLQLVGVWPRILRGPPGDEPVELLVYGAVFTRL